MREYTPDNRVDKISKGRKSREEVRIGGNNKISPNRLIEGGADILAAQLRNHHRVVAGKRARSPFVKYNLRVCVAS